MAEQQTPGSRGGGQRPPMDYQSGGQRRSTPPRRNDVIRCENCGEDYSITYKRCPFCDERPGRGGVVGKRVSNTRGGGYGRPASTMKAVSWIASFLVVIAALVIIYRFMDAPIFGGGKRPGSGSGVSSSSQSGSNSGSSSLPGGDVSVPDGPDASGSSPGTTPEPPEDNPPDDPASTGTPGTVVNAGSGLNIRSGPGRNNSVVATAANGSQVVVLGEENGWYQVRYSGDKTGYVSKDFVSTSDAPVAVRPTTSPEPSGGTTTVDSGTQGTIVNAGTGLNIRSGPGTDNSVVASASNGAKVTILGEENGWYQIRYSGSNTGYVSKEFVSVG